MWGRRLAYSLCMLMKIMIRNLDREKLVTIGESIGLVMVKYDRFLFGGNQLAVFAQDR